jgi:hypothetical protein
MPQSDFNQDDAEVLIAWTGIMGEKRAHPAFIVCEIIEDGYSTPVVLARRGWLPEDVNKLLQWLCDHKQPVMDEFITVDRNAL